MCENFYYTNPQSQLVGLETYMHAMGAFTIKGPTTHRLSAKKNSLLSKDIHFLKNKISKYTYSFILLC
jgi:hypothetical protein